MARKRQTDLGPVLYLELVPLADDVPWPIRTRRALKALLRNFKLRCRAFVGELPMNAAEFPDEREL